MNRVPILIITLLLSTFLLFISCESPIDPEIIDPEILSPGGIPEANRITYFGNGADGGTVPTDNSNYSEADSVLLADAGDMSKSDFSFVGWALTSNGLGGSFYSGSYISMPAEPLTLFAQWSQDPTYHVTYNGTTFDSGAVPADNNNYLDGGIAIIRGSETLAKVHYTFSSWNTEENGSGTTFNTNDTLTISNRDISLYAQWAEDPKYKVIYNKNSSTSGDVPTDDLTYYDGEEATVLANSEGLMKLFNSFLCWNSKADGSGQDYYSGDRVILSSEDFHLYAKWNGLPSHRIYYHADNADSGSVPVDNSEYYNGDSITILEHGGLTKELYGFDGWNSDEDGNGLTYSSGSVIDMADSDIHLYAQWVLGEDTLDVGSFDIRMFYSSGGTFGAGVNNNNFYLENYDPIPALPDQTVSPFWIAETEVTYEQWSTVYTWASSNGYHFQNAGRQGGDTNLQSNAAVGTDKNPVTRISWRDAIVFCNAITEYYNNANGTSLSCVYEYNGVPIRDSRDDNGSQCDNATENSSAKGFRLPYNMEWECAARYNEDGNWTDGRSLSGGGPAYGDKAACLEVAVFSQYADDSSTGVNSTAFVKSKLANELGCFDMSGNVSEWCFDVSPVFPDNGEEGFANRIYRGGSWGERVTAAVVGYYDQSLWWSEETTSIGVGYIVRSTIGLRLFRNP
ncbi:MAG: SUMF1/EgtB/PvdO family nonheme iron enzyme [Spirochaetaceae bacterium]|nr:SUMF1/EgtB/PvdO family nonheme iron enzyme [Spirochaetaceae bacterium]